MKQTVHNHDIRILAGNNEAWLQVLQDNGAHLDDVLGILKVIAQVMDYIAKGEDFYLVLGSTMKRDSFMLNWKGQGAPGAVYATDLAGLSTAAEELL
jgi:hypothetical protein